MDRNPIRVVLGIPVWGHLAVQTAIGVAHTMKIGRELPPTGPDTALGYEVRVPHVLLGRDVIIGVRYEQGTFVTFSRQALFELAEHMRAEYLFMVDADVAFDLGHVLRGVQILEETRKASAWVAACKMRQPPHALSAFREKSFVPMTDMEGADLMSNGIGTVPCRATGLACACIRMRDALAEADRHPGHPSFTAFDARFADSHPPLLPEWMRSAWKRAAAWIGEDVLFTGRLADYGGQVLLDLSCQVTHHVEVGIAPFIRPGPPA